MTENNQTKRGGAREGAGRPEGSGKYGEPTVSIRVPESKRQFIEDYLAGKSPLEPVPDPVRNALKAIGHALNESTNDEVASCVLTVVAPHDLDDGQRVADVVTTVFTDSSVRRAMLTTAKHLKGTATRKV